MDIYIQSTVGECSEFISEGKDAKESISIVISPLKVKTSGDEMTLRVINGCNMWQACFNKSCFFSKIARSAPKTRAQSD